jgi:tungstate transport system ATP-binding protein
MRSTVSVNAFKPEGTRALLRLRGVTVRAGKVSVLNEIDLDLQPARRTVIIGPNGAGKSTLLQVIHGLIQPDAGTILTEQAQAEGRPIRSALVFQRPVMLRRSVLGNIEHALHLAGVPGHLRREQALAALHTVDLAYAAQRPARSLSGGEQQRLSIARAQALKPDCLLLDEPTASLDPAAGAAVERYLMQLAQEGFGLVMCTHDLALARRFAQDAILMHQGRVIESGPAQAFFEAPRTDQARRFLAGEWLDQP